MFEKWNAEQEQLITDNQGLDNLELAKLIYEHTNIHRTANAVRIRRESMGLPLAHRYENSAESKAWNELSKSPMLNKWSSDEEAFLYANISDAELIQKFIEKFGRTESAVKARLRKLGLKLGTPQAIKLANFEKEFILQEFLESDVSVVAKLASVKYGKNISILNVESVLRDRLKGTTEVTKSFLNINT